MTFTYAGDPAASDLAAVRFKIQDTDSNDPLLTDEEIEFAIDGTGSVDKAAASCARALAFKFARLANRAMGSLRVDYNGRASTYAALAAELAKGQTIPLFAELSDPDDKLTRGLMDNPSVTADETVED